MSTVWALLLIAMRWPGAASLARWRSALGLSGMEIAAYGPPLGVVAASLGLLWVSTLVGLGACLAVAAGVASAGGAVTLSGGRGDGLLGLAVDHRCRVRGRFRIRRTAGSGRAGIVVAKE